MVIASAPMEHDSTFMSRKMKNCAAMKISKELLHAQMDVWPRLSLSQQVVLLSAADCPSRRSKQEASFNEEQQTRRLDHAAIRQLFFQPVRKTKREALFCDFQPTVSSAGLPIQRTGSSLGSRISSHFDKNRHSPASFKFLLTKHLARSLCRQRNSENQFAQRGNYDAHQPLADHPGSRIAPALNPRSEDDGPDPPLRRCKNRSDHVLNRFPGKSPDQRPRPRRPPRATA